MKNFFKTIFAKIGDFFLDKDNNGDEKRFWGNILIICGIVYAFTHSAGESMWITSGGFITLGLGALTIAMKGDTMSSPTITQLKAKVEEAVTPPQPGATP